MPVMRLYSHIFLYALRSSFWIMCMNILEYYLKFGALSPHKRIKIWGYAKRNSGLGQAHIDRRSQSSVAVPAVQTRLGE